MLGTYMNRPWSEIARFYGQIDTPSGAAMLALVSAIQASRYAAGLFPWTSMMDLCVAQTPVIYPCDSPYLRIGPISQDTVELRYVDTWDEKKQWHRSVRLEWAFARLERVFDELHWFVPATGPTP